jgi:hypothetical protein
MTKLQRPTTAPALYEQDGLGESAIIHEHYFIGGSDWLVTEFNPDDDLAFGWACLNGDRQNAELGYVSIAELESIQFPLNVGVGANGMAAPILLGYQQVERDEGWPANLTLTQGIALLDQRQGR